MKETRVLVTGATGNVGKAVIDALMGLEQRLDIIPAVRNVERARQSIEEYADLEFRSFDFEDRNRFQAAFRDIDLLFLLRPPQLADVPKYFHPLLQLAKESGISRIVFLSVQGAEKSKVIPHNKIERKINELGFAYIFLRPGYFMQNLTTTLLPEIRDQHSITLPSGNAKFNWIDVQNIGEVAARLIDHFDEYANESYELTGTESRSFGEVAALISEITQTTIDYRSMNPVSFFFRKWREGMGSSFALVMTLLHFLPRIQDQPPISDNYQKLTGKTPTLLREFIERELCGILKEA